MGYTKGPWRIGEQWAGSKDSRYIEKSIMTATNPSDEIAVVTHRGSALDEANARLIAAAPALLSALKDALLWIEVLDDDAVPDAKAPAGIINNARAAIARALGEGP